MSKNWLTSIDERDRMTRHQTAKPQEASSILSNLDKGVDKPKDWQALFAIADEIETRKTNHLCIYAVTVDNDHIDKVSWEKLLELIDKLP